MLKDFFRINKNRIISIAAVTSITVGITIILIGMFIYKNRISQLGLSETMNYQSYRYHYAIISEEADAPFWEAIYQGALENGKELDAYVEKIGSNLTTNYSLEQLLEIAIASKVDGIILESNGVDNIDELINRADKSGIPVITVLRDAPYSNRKSFVGINSYKQGQAYSQQVLNVLQKGKHKITILINSNSKDTSQDVIYSSIREAVAGLDVEVRAESVNTQSTFSSEEEIRNIIMDQENPSDVLVCLTAADTLGAYRAVVDYNKVGQIDIIGYYDSDMILSAIEKNIIHSTMTIDAKYMGALCVEALSEYKETKRVSDYFSVDINVIDQNSISEYLSLHNETENEMKISK